MYKFILITFAFLGWSFYEMSGGSDFEPASARLTDIRTDPLKPSAIDNTETAEVTRVSLNLTSVNDVLTNGGLRSSNLPQQDQGTTTPAVVQTAALDQGESVTILPSLAIGATAETDIDIPAPVATEATVSSASFESVADIRSVTGNRVNVRGGPGTDFGIVGKLTRGAEVEILEDTGTGWVRFQALDGSTAGWMADFLLTN